LRDGVVVGDAFGRRLVHGTIEAQGPWRQIGVVGIGGAAFVDGAKAWARSASDTTGPTLLDAGLGLRLRLPAAGTVRLDVAAPLRHGTGLTVSAALVSPWPH
jgi:hemolysin activation/secretion protein